MSLTKLLTSLSPSSLFKKDVITFLVIRRHDLGVPTESLRYLSVHPNATLTSLRHKIWHLLDLPDYCDEKIILKDERNVELPLTELRKGNTPQKPFVLEVWLPEKRMLIPTHHNMLTMGREESCTTLDRIPSESTCDCKSDHNKSSINCHKFSHQQHCNYNNTNKADFCTCSETTVSMDPIAMNVHKRPLNTMTQADFKKSDLCARISSTTLLLKLQGKKSKDNFSNILLKIQTDLNSLSQKLSSLENRIPT